MGTGKRMGLDLKKNANAGLFAGFLLLLGSLSCPCPFCCVDTASLMAGGVAGKDGAGGVAAMVRAL